MPATYTFSLKNVNTLLRSSSGGAFWAVASCVIRAGGIVYGAVIDQTGLVKHTRAEAIDQLKPLQGSKYVMSRMGTTLKDVLADLKAGKKVLFVGTPCQVAALHAYLNNLFFEQLILMDFICHGCPKPIHWKRYLELSGQKEPYSISFRKKEPSWEKFSLTINGYQSTWDKDRFYFLFLNNYVLQESCYACKYKGENRFSDITIGDAWGCEHYDIDNKNELGTSLVFIRDKQEFLKRALLSQGTLTEVFYHQAIMYNSAYIQSVAKPADQEEVIDRFQNLGEVPLDIQTEPKKPFSQKIKNWFVALLYAPQRRKRKRERSLPNKANVGIVSLFGYFNYGNKLQSFALSYLIRHAGLNPVNIYTDVQFPNPSLCVLYQRLIRRQKETGLDKKRRALYNVAQKYHESRFHYSDSLNSINELNKLKGLLFGSDQVWNPACSNPWTYAFQVGIFPTENIKPIKVSYAASIANDHLDETSIEYLKTGLKTFNAISVREKSTQDILKSIGIHASVNLDPTFLLSKEEWDKAIKRYAKIKPPKSYTLVYLLGGAGFDAKSIPGPVIDVLDPDSRFFAINPFDFIRLIRDAENIITDSFHACVFSIIFGKSLCVTQRENNPEMGTRITSLFTQFGIPLRFDSFFDCATSVNHELWQKALNESRTYLSSILQMIRGEQ